MVRRRLHLMLVALVLAATGCADRPAPKVSPSRPPVGSRCPELAGSGRPVTFGDGLAGVVLGDGPTGVVLAHMHNGTVCQWLPYGAELVARGYRVLVFDFAGYGSSPRSDVPLDRQVAQAVDALRRDGTSRTVLIGGSMGGTAVLVATPALAPPPVAVVALSPPSTMFSVDATTAAPKIAVPVLYAAGRQEAGYPDSVRGLYQATTGTPGRKFVLAPTAEHGVDLIDPKVGDPGLRDEVATFLAAHAPPR